MARNWTEQEQADAYGLAGRILAKKCSNRPDWWREKVQLAAWERWLIESNGAKIDQYVRWAISDANEASTAESRAESEFTEERASAATRSAENEEKRAVALLELRQIETTTPPVQVRGRLKEPPTVMRVEDPDRLREELKSLARRWFQAHRRNSADERFADMANILLALADDDCDLSQLAGPARKHLGLRGVRTRANQIDNIVYFVKQRKAELIVGAIRSSPAVERDAPRLWDENVLSIVQTALDEELGSTAEATMKAIFRALGYPASKIDGLDRHLRVREARRKKSRRASP